MATSTPKVDHFVFIAYLNSHLSQLFRLITFVQKNHLGRSTLIFDSRYDSIDPKYLAQARAIDLQILDVNGYPYQTSRKAESQIEILHATAQGKTSPVETLKKVPLLLGTIRNVLGVTSFFSEVLRLQRAILRVRKLFHALEPNIIILPEENVVYGTPVYTKTAQRLGIPSVVFPYTMADPSEYYESYYDSEMLQSDRTLNRFVGYLFPKWTYVANGRWLILLPWPKVLALEVLQLSPSTPWMINSGFSIVATESEAMEKFYLHYGITAEQLRVVGSLSDDVLYRKLQDGVREKEKLCKKYGMDPERPILLCALFPFREMPKKSDFSSYTEMVEFWIQSLAAVKNFNVIVNPHPRLHAETLDLVKQYGLTMVTENIVELIPLCDVYVANISATIRWANACGKPVLNCDFYKFRCHHYDAARGTVTVETRAEFLTQLQKMVGDAAYYETLQQAQAACRADWGFLDGKCHERIHSLFETLLHHTINTVT